MKKNVVISLMGVQRYDETPPDVIELVTQGQLHEEEDGALVLTYEESELTGLEGTRTTLRIEGERVVMLREGELNTQMIFEEAPSVPVRDPLWDHVHRGPDLEPVH